MKRNLLLLLILKSLIFSVEHPCKAQMYVSTLTLFSVDWNIPNEQEITFDTVGQHNKIMQFMRAELPSMVNFERNARGSRLKFKLYLDASGDVYRVTFDYPATSLLEAKIRAMFIDKMPKWKVTKTLSPESTAIINFDVDATFYVEDKEYFYDNGVKQFEKGNYTKALKDFNYSIEHYPYFTDALYNRAVCYLKLQDTINACIDWKKAGKLEDLESKQLYLKNCKGK